MTTIQIKDDYAEIYDDVHIPNPHINLWQDFYVRFFGFIIPASEIRYELKVLK